jgi:hypothetical protein
MFAEISEKDEPTIQEIEESLPKVSKVISHGKMLKLT